MLQIIIFSNELRPLVKYLQMQFTIKQFSRWTNIPVQFQFLFVVIINPNMRIILIDVVILFVSLHFVGASLTREPHSIKSGELELTTSRKGDHEDMTFPFPEEVSSGDRVAISSHTLQIHYTYEAFLNNISWEVSFLEASSNIALHLTSTQSTIEWRLRIGYIIIPKEYSSSLVSLHSSTLQFLDSSLQANNGKHVIMIRMQEAFQNPQIFYSQNEIMVFLRGFSSTGELPKESTFITFVRRSLFDAFLQVKMSGINRCFITFLTIDKQRFSEYGLKIQATHQYMTLQKQGQQISSILLNEIKIDEKCDKRDEYQNCWMIKTLNQIEIKQISSFSLSTDQKDNNFPISERRLSCMSNSVCTCSDPHATQCWRDWWCNCYVKSCMPGYYAGWFATSCKQCPAVANCAGCFLQFGKSTPTCNSCTSGYAAINGACVACPFGCNGCTTVTVSGTSKVSCSGCAATLTAQTSNGVTTCGCLSNQFLSGSTCTSCPGTCASCTSLSTCTGCPSGRYLSGGNCLTCMPVCKTCSAGGTCDSCTNALFTLVAGVCTCNSPYFFDAVTKTCVSCSSMQSNCASCGYASAYSPSNPPSIVCVTASSGYYVTANGTTSACIPYCSNCNSNPLLCDTPQANFVFDGTNCVCSAGLYYSSGTCTTCDAIVPGCISCQTNAIPAPTDCLACDPIGYYNSTTYPVTSCPSCAPLCTSCIDYSNCFLCVNNLVPIMGVCTCDSNVSLYYDSSSQSCLACNLVIFNCQSCVSNGSTSVSCLSCGVGLFVSPDGLLCSPCPITCADCLNSTYCTVCEAGYDMVNDSCICSSNCTSCMGNSTDGLCSSCTYGPFVCLGCMAGNLLNLNGTCSSCSSLFSACADCTNSTCTSCLSPFILIPFGCVCNSTAGLYLSLDGSTCLPCGSVITNCLSCINNGSQTMCTATSPGFFLTNNSQSCDPCSGFCLTCTNTSTSCGSCLPTFVIVANMTCDCDNANGYFYDSSTQGCSVCTAILTNCLACSLVGNLTTCSFCANTFYWDTNTSSCVQCPSTCNNCSSVAVCTSCPSSFVLSQTVPGWTVIGQCVCDNSSAAAPYYDNLSGTCQPCSYFFPSCSICSNNGTSAVCVSCSGGTYLANGSCHNCPSSCGNCSSSTVCTSCPGNLTLSGGACICDSQCSQCQGLSIGCISCSISGGSLTSCLACEPGTYLVSPNCLACPSTCATCSSSTTCLTCQPSYILSGGLCSCATTVGIFPNSAGVCVPCVQIYYGCSDCSVASGSTTCAICDDGYFLSGSQCLVCNSSCLTCSGSSSNCASCITGQTLVNNTCVCTDAACVACNTNSPHCVQCVYTIYGNFSKCDICESGYYLNGISCSLCPTACVTCATGGVCLTCPNTFQVINGSCFCNEALAMWKSGGVCVSCTSLYPNCQTCTQNTSDALNVSCSTCLYGFYIQNSSCVASVCGDGVITSGQTCDDGNTLSNDGCSSSCLIEVNFACVGVPSVCTMNLNYHIYFKSIEVSPSVCNEVSVSFTMDPVYTSYDQADFSNMLSYTNNPNLIYKSWSYSAGVVTYTFSYVATINNQSVTFFFAPATLGVNQTTTVPIITVSATILSNNNIAIVHYEQADCESKAMVRGLATTVEYVSYGALALSALPCKIVGLELFGVLQLAHISVGNIDNVNTMLTPLMEMKGVQGFTANLGKQHKKRLLQDSLTPSRVDSIGYQANFLRNCNVMLVIVVVVIAVALVPYALTFCLRQYVPSLHNFSRRAMKEVLLTVILFNCFNFAYSAGLHFTYASTDDPLYQLGTAAAVLSLVLPLMMVLGLMCADQKGFGEFKEKFKPGTVQRLYFVVTIIYRTGIGLYVSTMNQDSLSTLIVMALSIGFLLYNFVNLPYKKAYHNYRANVCHVTQCISLFVAMYYRSMMSTTPDIQMSTVYTPAYVEIVAILISLVVSVAVLIYEIYLFAKECCSEDHSEEKEREKEEKVRIVNTHDNEKEGYNRNNFSIDQLKPDFE